MGRHLAPAALARRQALVYATIKYDGTYYFIAFVLGMRGFAMLSYSGAYCPDCRVLHTVRRQYASTWN